MECTPPFLRRLSNGHLQGMVALSTLLMTSEEPPPPALDRCAESRSSVATRHLAMDWTRGRGKNLVGYIVLQDGFGAGMMRVRVSQQQEHLNTSKHCLKPEEFVGGHPGSHRWAPRVSCELGRTMFYRRATKQWWSMSCPRLLEGLESLSVRLMGQSCWR